MSSDWSSEMMRRWLLVLLFGLGVSAIDARADAACARANACVCQVALTTLAFGNYDPFSDFPDDSVGTLSVSCSSPDPANSTFSVALNGGSSGRVSERVMKSGSYSVFYNVYADAAHSIIWGDGTGGGQPVVAGFPTVSRQAVTLNLYGRVPARQNVHVGSYRDTLTVTITY
jgi:spore coat protein U-like protein